MQFLVVKVKKAHNSFLSALLSILFSSDQG